ncbi:MAG: prepilin peptidase [Myxococcota bacterium]
MIIAALVTLLHALLFLGGACLGSFLGVVIDRLGAAAPAGLCLPHPASSQTVSNPSEVLGAKGLWSPRSHCLDCNAPLAWFDLIPVLSYLLLRGRCRRCGAHIPPRLLWLEVFCGLLALCAVARWGLSWCAVGVFTLCWFLLALAWIDLRTGFLPLNLLVGLLISGWGFGLVDSGRVLPQGNQAFACVLNASFVDRLIGAAAAFAALAGVLLACTAWLRARGRLTPGQTAMGWGDPLLLAGIGAHVGWSWLPGIVMLACSQGLLVALWSRWRGEPGPLFRPGERSKGSDKDDEGTPAGAFPFGPFLASGTWTAIAAELLWPGVLP